MASALSESMYIQSVFGITSTIRLSYTASDQVVDSRSQEYELRCVAVFSPNILSGTLSRVAEFLILVPTAGANVCSERKGHQCTERSCCPFDNFEETNDTLHGLCEEHGQTAVCCMQPENCNWENNIKNCSSELLGNYLYK